MEDVMKKKVQRTPEERREAIARIDSLKKTGATHREACKTEGISESIYYAWKSRAKAKKRAKPQAQHLVMQLPDKDERLVIVMGKPAEVDRALAAIAAIHGS
jgi:transposase-like protein